MYLPNKMSIQDKKLIKTLAKDFLINHPNNTLVNVALTRELMSLYNITMNEANAIKSIIKNGTEAEDKLNLELWGFNRHTLLSEKDEIDNYQDNDTRYDREDVINSMQLDDPFDLWKACS